MKQDIDIQYRQWLERVADGDRLDGLRHRIVDTVRQAPDGVGQPAGQIARPPMMGGWRLAWAAALVGTLGVGAALFIAQHPSGVSHEGGHVSAPSGAGAFDHALLFQAVTDLFGPELQWVLLDDGQLDMGIDPRPDGWGDGSSWIGVHVDLMERSADGAWQSLWEGELVLRAGSLADVAMWGPAGARLQVWVYPHADGQMVFDSSVFMNGESPVAMHSAGLVGAGVPYELPQVEALAQRYRVVQTLVPLLGDSG